MCVLCVWIAGLRSFLFNLPLPSSHTWVSRFRGSWCCGTSGDKESGEQGFGASSALDRIWTHHLALWGTTSLNYRLKELDWVILISLPAPSDTTNQELVMQCTLSWVDWSRDDQRRAIATGYSWGWEASAHSLKSCLSPAEASSLFTVFFETCLFRYSLFHFQTKSKICS